MGLWGSQQGFSLGNEWWMGSFCFHVFYCSRHILRQNDSSRITLCSLLISMKNKTKKEPRSVPCQTWKYLFRKAATTILRAKCRLPVGWVGGERLKDSAPRHREPEWYCNIAAADLWAETLICCSIKSRAWKKLMAHHQWDPEKTNGEVPLICPPGMYLLVSTYWWLSTRWWKKWLASCILALLGKNQTGKREMD